MALEINPDIEIKDSPIEGKGLFTKVPIKKVLLFGFLRGKNLTTRKFILTKNLRSLQNGAL